MEKANNETEASNHFGSLKRLAYFAAVVECGSFTAAAERLGITKAVVSQQVARLERDFQTTLLTRTTRKVLPTAAGTAFYQRCAVVLRDAGEAFDELAEVSTEPSGTLRLTAPLDYGIAAVVPVISEFIRRYPKCKVDAVFSDQALDLASAQVELAIRVGWLTKLNLQARKIGTFRQVLVAAGSWRRRVARLREPEDIASLPFIANSALRDPTHWTFTRADDRRRVGVQSSVSIDTTLAVCAAVLRGAGLSVLPDYAISEHLARGDLIRVLPDWSLPSGGIHAVFPAARFRPAKVRAFVELMTGESE